jgi:hypothetical protein
VLLRDIVRGRSGDPRSPGGRAARIAIALLVVAGVAWALAAAAARRTSMADPPASVSQPAAMADLHKLPPIYPLVYTRTESDERIEAAQERLVTACMAKRGFSYDPGTPAKADEAADGPAPFGLESLEARGMDPDASLPPETPGGKGKPYARALFGDPERRVTARGERTGFSRPATGCLAAAEQRLLGDARVRWMQLRVLLFEAEQESRRLLERDTAFRAATGRWRECMERAGFTVPDPLRLPETVPPETEIRTHPAARSDVRCKAETGYLTTAYTRLAAVQRRLLSEDPSVLADWKSLMRRQDTAARKVLGAG